MTSYLTQKEFEILENLKKLSVNETATLMKITTSNIHSTLYHIRNKYDKCRNTVNIIENLRSNNQRLGKLLRRQGVTNREKEKDSLGEI